MKAGQHVPEAEVSSLGDEQLLEAAMVAQDVGPLAALETQHPVEGTDAVAIGGEDEAPVAQAGERPQLPEPEATTAFSDRLEVIAGQRPARIGSTGEEVELDGDARGVCEEVHAWLRLRPHPLLLRPRLWRLRYEHATAATIKQWGLYGFGGASTAKWLPELA